MPNRLFKFLRKAQENISILNELTNSLASRDTEFLNAEVSKMVYINYLFLLKVFHLAPYLALSRTRKKLEINPLIFHPEKINVFTWSLLHLFVTPS